MSGLDTAEQLWREIDSAASPYPEGVVEVPESIQGIAFFPGGLGLWLGNNAVNAELPVGQIMVVGQDFNSVKAYELARQRGTEVGISPTWKVLQEILRASNICPEKCFFANLYMGLRVKGRETGRFPGAKDKPFVRRCITFFERQLEVGRPKLIMALGIEPFRVLAKPVFDLDRPKTLTACAEIYPSVQLAHGSATVVALTHPSLSHLNIGRRKYGQLAGAEAEKAMIADGLKLAFPKDQSATPA